MGGLGVDHGGREHGFASDSWRGRRPEWIRTSTAPASLPLSWAPWKRCWRTSGWSIPPASGAELPAAGGMWQSWQTIPALAWGLSFHSRWVALTHRPHGSFSLWQVPQNSAVARKGLTAISWPGLSVPVRTPCSDLAGIDDEVEVEGHLALEADDGVAQIAAHALVGAGPLGRTFRRDVSGEEGERCVAAVAAGLDAGHLFHLFGVGQREIEVLDLVPVVGEALMHERLFVLASDGGVALAAGFVGLEVVVGVSAEGGISGGSGSIGDNQRTGDHANNESTSGTSWGPP